MGEAFCTGKWLHDREKDCLQKMQNQKANRNMQHSAPNRKRRARRKRRLHGIWYGNIRRTNRKMQAVHSLHIISMGEIKMMNTKQSAPDATKVYAAIAAIISRREGKKVNLIEVRRKDADIVRKAG